jgi:MinD-like ATPase involved in chromosome partitioning or flagellar assembly
MLIALASIKGSPGVTTAALALAATWPTPRRLVVEADPSGGDLATWLGLPPSPGLMDLAALARHDAGPDAVWRCARQLPGGPHLLTAPPSGEQARACVTTVAATPVLARFAKDEGPAVLADCGRLDPDSPALRLAQQADLTVLVARPHLSDLAHVAQRTPDLVARGLHLALLLAASPRRLPSEAIYPAREVADVLQLTVVGQLPADDRGVALVIVNQAALSRRGMLLPLPRAAAAIATALASRQSTGQQVTAPHLRQDGSQVHEVAEVSGELTR